MIKNLVSFLTQRYQYELGTTPKRYQKIMIPVITPLLKGIVCVFVVFILMMGGTAQAQPQFIALNQTLWSNPAQLSKDLLTEFETEVLPQIEQILTPQQLEQFRTDMLSGNSFRKAFKSILLNSEQKNQLKTLLKSVSAKETFTEMTPEQKKRLFMKKKEMFAPTMTEITDRIDAAIKEKGDFLPEAVKQKINAGIQKMETQKKN